MSLRRFSARALLAAGMLLGLSSSTCGRAADHGPTEGRVASYSATGVIKRVESTEKGVLISHDDIPGYMKAMTMFFEVRDMKLLDGMTGGDKITFSFTDEGKGKLVIQEIKKQP